MAAKWPALALYDKQNAVGVEIAVDVVDAGDHGPTTPWFRLCCLWTGKGSGRGAFKILDVAMMQSQGGDRQGKSALPYILYGVGVEEVRACNCIWGHALCMYCTCSEVRGTEYGVVLEGRKYEVTMRPRHGLRGKGAGSSAMVRA